MNALDIYRALPRTNCGSCSRKACMPFALALLQGTADLAECIILTDDGRAKLADIRSSDWREDLIATLRSDIAGMDLCAAAGDLGGRIEADGLQLTCMGREFVIRPDGGIVSPQPVSPWMKILLLHYLRTNGSGELSRTWASFGELKAGMVKASSFFRECEDPMRALFDRNAAGVETILRGLGAERNSNLPSPVGLTLFLLPRVPVAILYWPSDEEFPSKAAILFDRTADRFLDVESLIFLVEGLVKTVEAALIREAVI